MDLAYLRFCGTPAFGRDGLRRALDAPAANPTPLFTILAFPAMVLERAGLDPRCYRDVPLARRTAACVRALRAPSVGVAGERLAADPRLAAPALNSLLIGASAFFRDAPVFAAIARIVAAEFGARGRALRVASVGCSSGAELYSVAILLAEAGLLASADLLGIDCRDDMRRQLQQLVRLVDDLLDATRVSRNKVQVRKSRADFGAVVQHAIDASRADIELAGHVLDVDMPRQPVWLEADPERLAQVVANLLNNATRYTPRGGRVGVSVEALPGEVRLRVTDTGVGIEPRNLSRIFEMFTQVGGPGSGGLGIGLAIVRGIIDLHGGTVEAHSEGVGHGSQFVVTLPRSATAAEAVGTATTRIVAPVARRVLVVDDNTDAAAMLGAFLELHGHTVLIAHDALAALTAAGEAVPDVALLDIGLPGMDGYELARRLREGDATRHVRLVALTGWGQDGDRARAREAGFDVHLTKPAEPHMILGVL